MTIFRSMFKSKDAVCPYCMRPLNLGDMRFFCTYDKERHHEVFLSILDRLNQRLPLCSKTFCKGNGKPVAEAACRYCGETLPPQLLFHDKFLRFCVLGVAGAGKSSYVTTMLHELKYSGLPWVLQAMDSDTNKDSQAAEQNVYEARHCPEGTKAGVAPKPQQWVILDNSGDNQNLEQIPTYSFTIYDGAGEDCEKIGDKDIDEVVRRYISGSKMFAIMFDPLLLTSVRASLPNDVLNSSMATERQTSAPANMVTMVNSLANYIRQSCNIQPGRRIDRQAAIVITKMDTLRDMPNGFGSSSTVMKSSPHAKAKGFVDSDSEMVDMEIRDWLKRQGETAFLDAIDANFQPNKIRVFGISSFGQPPDKLKRLPTLTPHRVLDPIMWMLASEGIMPIV